MKKTRQTRNPHANNLPIGADDRALAGVIGGRTAVVPRPPEDGTPLPA
jgi:hypothetical protein